MSYTKKGSTSVLYKTVREFYDSPNEIYPSNYMIVLQKDMENYGEMPSFTVKMMLNNKPQKITQEFNILLNFNTLENGVAENEYFAESHSQDHYFDEILNHRIRFKPYTPMEMKKSIK